MKHLKERPLTMKEITCIGKTTTVTLIGLQTLNMITIITMVLGIIMIGCPKEKIEAPTFDGCLDPWVFTDWLRQMEKFFDYYHWVENKKVRYVRMKLIGRVNLFWEDLEENFR